jgi:hypothetical protein
MTPDDDLIAAFDRVFIYFATTAALDLAECETCARYWVNEEWRLERVADLEHELRCLHDATYNNGA